MSRADLVRSYFKLQPTLRDQIAEGFRAKYRELKAELVEPDRVFSLLKAFAAGPDPSPGRETAALAALAFFFEECDIFERPEAEGPP